MDYEQAANAGLSLTTSAQIKISNSRTMVGSAATTSFLPQQDIQFYVESITFLVSGSQNNFEFITVHSINMNLGQGHVVQSTKILFQKEFKHF